MGKISENFEMSEFAVSASHPDLIEEVPRNLQPHVIALVTSVLQPLRTATGWRCKITSGYRGKNLNEAVGGVETSQHRRGEAGDTQWYDSKGKQIPTINVLIKATELRLPFDQMIAYDRFVHFSHTTKRKNRRQTLYNKGYKGKRI